MTWPDNLKNQKRASLPSSRPRNKEDSPTYLEYWSIRVLCLSLAYLAFPSLPDGPRWSAHQLAITAYSAATSILKSCVSVRMDTVQQTPRATLATSTKA